jgi:hypothetical protein
MTPDDVAARYDNRPGYRIVDYGKVGLPVYRVTAIGLTLQKKRVEPIEEFVLRAVALGLRDPEDVAGVLGLPQNLVDGIITALVSDETIRMAGTIEMPLCELTEKGRMVLEEEAQVKPVEQTLPFHYDGFLRQPKWFGDAPLLPPKELKEAGIPELRSYPDRGPDLHEVEVKDVGDLVALAAGRANEGFTLLRLSSIEKRVRLFYEAVALAYKSDDGSTVQIAFALDGRLSEPHERAFAEMKGLERNEIFLGLRHAPDVKSQLPDADLRKKVRRPELRRSRAKLAAARTKAVVAKQASNAGSEKEARDEVARAEEELSRAKEELEKEQVRPLEVYDHPKLLEEAIKTAQQRVLIISPWIRSKVVTDKFIGAVRLLCERKVMVYIGYGLGTRDADERPNDRKAREALHELAVRYPNCRVHRLGDTHAKVLIKDSEFYVTSSFNWLSFRGDRNRTFREEIGTLIAIPERVDNLFDKLVARFPKSGAEVPA